MKFVGNNLSSFSLKLFVESIHLYFAKYKCTFRPELICLDTWLINYDIGFTNPNLVTQILICLIVHVGKNVPFSWGRTYQQWKMQLKNLSRKKKFCWSFKKKPNLDKTCSWNQVNSLALRMDPLHFAKWDLNKCFKLS